MVYYFIYMLLSYSEKNPQSFGHKLQPRTPLVAPRYKLPHVSLPDGKLHEVTVKQREGGQSCVHINYI